MCPFGVDVPSLPAAPRPPTFPPNLPAVGKDAVPEVAHMSGPTKKPRLHQTAEEQKMSVDEWDLWRLVAAIVHVFQLLNRARPPAGVAMDHTDRDERMLHDVTAMARRYADYLAEMARPMPTENTIYFLGIVFTLEARFDHYETCAPEGSRITYASLLVGLRAFDAELHYYVRNGTRSERRKLRQCTLDARGEPSELERQATNDVRAAGVHVRQEILSIDGVINAPKPVMSRRAALRQ